SSFFNEDGKTGLIVPPQDPHALAEAIKKIIDDPEMYKKMSENARKRAERFSEERMLENYEEVYQFLMRKNERKDSHQ
ncbi:MAG: glycosyltransferase, partial [Synergistaceae bacterium]|nr:glycosyltransferase [Synergistaceae bacterium]